MSYHVPLIDSISDEDPFFEDLLEPTFPPIRYLPLFYDRVSEPISRRPRRHSSRERDRLYKELVGHEPYSKKHIESNKPNGFQVKLDVKHYKPDEVTLKVEGQVLEITGKHRNECEHGFETSEFLRKYTIPETVDPKTLTSNISQDGVLCIAAAPKAVQAIEESDEEEREKFLFNLDVNGFKPDEITINVVGRDMVIHGETKDERSSAHGTHSHHKQFTRKVALPNDVDPASLSSRITKDSQLTIEAPRNANTTTRKLEIMQE